MASFMMASHLPTALLLVMLLLCLFDGGLSICVVKPDNGTVVWDVAINSSIIPGYAFYLCADLINITFINGKVTKVEDYAFYDSGLNMNVDLQSVETIGNSAFSKTKPGNVDLRSAKSIGEAAFWETNIERVDLIGLKIINYMAFKDCKHLVEVNFGEGLTTIEDEAFYTADQQQGITSLRLPNSLTSIGTRAFKKTYYLKEVIFGENLAYIGKEAFDQSGLESIALPESIEFIGRRAFYMIPHLKNVTIFETPTKAIDTVIDKYAFGLATGLISVTLPPTVSSIGRGAFQMCYYLSFIDLGVSLVSIGQEAFAAYALDIKVKDDDIEVFSSLTSVILPPTLREIGEDAFLKSSLKSLHLPESLEKIGATAFQECAGLQNVTIPKGVKEVGTHAFRDCVNLEVCLINSENTTFGANIFEGTKVGAIGTIFLTKAIIKAEGFESVVDINCYADNSGRKCYCRSGYGNMITDTSLSESYFSCAPCSKGMTSSYPLSQEACEDCVPGRYAEEASSIFCNECETGKYLNASGSSDANDCRVCEAGYYSSEMGTAECQPCGEGQYQAMEGQVRCEMCAVGRYSSIATATNSSACALCPAGKYTNQNGTTECTECAEGNAQPRMGQASCEVCKDTEHYTYKSNAEKTACEIDLVLSKSLAEEFFEDGLALGGTFAIAAAFVAMGLLMTFMREKDPERLANYSRLEALWNSFMAGFSFGAELFLVVGMWGAAKGLAAAILLSRLSQFVVGVGLVAALYGRLDLVESAEKYVSGLLGARDCVDEEFCRENVYMVEGVSLLTFFDVSMLQFMPWKKSRFFVLSEGYPTMSMMRICMGVKTVQSLVSVICETWFLALNDMTNHGEAQALLGLNIAFGVLTVLMDILVLCLRGGILQETERERAKSAQKATEQRLEKCANEEGSSTNHLPSQRLERALSEPETDADGGITSVSSGEEELELADLYANKDDDRPTSFSNPMHSLGAVAVAPTISDGNGVHITSNATNVVALQQRAVDQSREIDSPRREQQQPPHPTSVAAVESPDIESTSESSLTGEEHL